MPTDKASPFVLDFNDVWSVEMSLLFQSRVSACRHCHKKNVQTTHQLQLCTAVHRAGMAWQNDCWFLQMKQTSTFLFGGLMKQAFVFVLLLCLSFQVACTKGPGSTQAAREERTGTDADLKNQIEDRFNSDAELRAANLGVKADADHNMVTLSGTVPSETLRTKAVNMAKAVRPGMTVDDKIDVKPSETVREVSRSEYTQENARQEVEKARANKESVGDSIDDAWIHSKIVAKLITDKDTPEHKINVDVMNNIVTLRGWVDNAKDRQEAERIAAQTDGVKRVNNQLKVGRS
jgi:osmotically-inducible protein OsmY